MGEEGARQRLTPRTAREQTQPCRLRDDTCEENHPQLPRSGLVQPAVQATRACGAELPTGAGRERPARLSASVMWHRVAGGLIVLVALSACSARSGSVAVGCTTATLSGVSENGELMMAAEASIF